MPPIARTAAAERRAMSNRPRCRPTDIRRIRLEICGHRVSLIRLGVQAVLPAEGRCVLPAVGFDSDHLIRNKFRRQRRIDTRQHQSALGSVLIDEKLSRSVNPIEKVTTREPWLGSRQLAEAAAPRSSRAAGRFPNRSAEITAASGYELRRAVS